MPRKTKRQRKPEEVHSQLAIRVELYEACVNASINHDIYAPQYAWRLNDDDLIYKFTAQLTITGISIYPKGRAGDIYELTIYGDDAPSLRHDATLRDAQARDERGSPQFAHTVVGKSRSTIPQRAWGCFTRSGGSRVGQRAFLSRRDS